MSFTDFGTLNTMLGASGAWLPAIDVLMKVTLLLGAASLASLALGRASAAVRHMVWTIALTSALLVPLLSIALPRWQLALVTVDAPAGPVTIALPDNPEPATESAPLARRAPQAETEPSPPSAAPIAAVPGEVNTPAPRSRELSVAMVLLAIWSAGVIAVLGRLLLGLAAVQWMWRRTARVVDAPWLPLAVELASELGILRRLTFLESRTATMPMAFGIFKPAVLMPADAVRWPVERLRIVLLHELAHVKRRDCLTHTIAQIACAVYWFNPLAWIAARRIRTERERACDDLVLACGTRGPDYAEELLEIARVMRAGRFPALITGATLAMAHRSQLEGRLMAILDPKLPRSGVSRVRAAVAAVTVACALPPIAALQPWVVAEAAPAAVVELPNRAAPASPSPVPQAENSQQPQPRPTPAPVPDIPRPSTADLPQMTDVALDSTAQAAVQGVAQAAVQGVAQAAVQGAAQAAVQGATQGPVQAVVQDAVQAALHEVAEFTAQEGKRVAADPRMVAALTAALKDTDKDVRETAMQALVRLRDPAIFEPLVQALKDVAHDVREQAAQALGQMRDKRAVDPLIGALKDENPGVREQAAFALGQLRDPRAVDALIGALKDTAPDVRQRAAFALGQLRDKRAATALSALIKDPNADVREQAVFALGQMRDVAAVDGLLLALRDSKPDVRHQAAFALGQIRDPRAVAPLISALKDENADVRQQAAFSLGQLRDRSSVEALVIALKDPVADVRQQVAFALGQLRDPRAIDGLTDALKDQSADVRRQAAFALGQLIR